MAENIIKTEGLRYVYSEGTPYEHAALDGVDIEIEKGSFVAVLGHNGSGKSTMAAVLADVFSASLVHMDDFFLPFEQKTPERLAQPGGNELSAGGWQCDPPALPPHHWQRQWRYIWSYLPLSEFLPPPEKPAIRP